MKDVALAAGVSAATVSNAFRGESARLSEAQRVRILQVAADLGYHGPDPTGRALRTGIVGAIGVMFSEALSFVFDDASAVMLLKGISQAAEDADLSLVLLPFPPSSTDEGRVVRHERDVRVVRRSLVDGFLAYSMPDDHPAVVTAVSRQLPTVIVDAPYHHDVHYVGIRDRAAAKSAAEHVLDLGHRKIGVLVDRLVPDGRSGFVTPARLRATQETVPRERLRGYRDAFRAAGIDWASVPVLEAGGLTVPHFDVAADRLLDELPELTAVVAVNDELALAMLRTCRRRGIDVPTQLSVVGFDDVPAAGEAGLSTVHQDFVEKGRVACQLLIDPVDTPQKVMLGTRFVVRQSTAPPFNRG
ncbi:MAG: substrate-binding domain-containing protein [Mycobacterium sp.]